MNHPAAPLDWSRDGATWPHREASRFVDAGGFRFHVQIAGPKGAPVLLLIHGTGAASHSWRSVIGPASASFRVVAPDLPGHGFTGGPTSPDLSLHGMTASLMALMAALGSAPAIIAGHSAGAAIAVMLAGNGRTAPQQVVSLNGAFQPIRGDKVLSPMAKLMVANPFSAGLFASLAAATPLGRNLLDSAGGSLDEAGEQCYRKLMATPAHVRGAMGMMAAWDVSRLAERIRTLPCPLSAVAARDDRLVPFVDSAHAARLAPEGRLILHESGGHLLHETRPDALLDLLPVDAGCLSEVTR